MTVGTKQKLAFQNEELSLTINFEKLQHSACEKVSAATGRNDFIFDT
jgi:hypothetical protein